MSAREPRLSSGTSSPGSALNYETVERLLALLGASAGSSAPLDERRRQIGTGLAALIDADVWMWARSRLASTPESYVIFDTVDGGFADDAERARFMATLYDPVVAEAFKRLPDAPEAADTDPCGRPTAGVGAAVRTRRIDDTLPAGSPARELWRRGSGLDAGLISMVSLGGPNWSSLGFHRRAGRPQFADQDLCVVHLAVASLDLLHRDGSDVAANTDKLFSFRPRERQVLLYLLAGDQTKQIAAKLGISHHTVADYVKVIYRRLGVGTRTELLRLFLPGSTPPGGS